MDLSEKYKKFIKTYESVSFNKAQKDAVMNTFILTDKIKRLYDLESLWVTASNKSFEYEFLYPSESKIDTYFVSVFSNASDDEGNILPEKVFENILPRFIPYIPETICELSQGSNLIESYTYPGAALAMKAVKENTSLKLNFSWGA